MVPRHVSRFYAPLIVAFSQHDVLYVVFDDTWRSRVSFMDIFALLNNNFYGSDRAFEGFIVRDDIDVRLSDFSGCFSTLSRRGIRINFAPLHVSLIFHDQTPIRFSTETKPVIIPVFQFKLTCQTDCK